MLTITKDSVLPCTVTGSWPRPRWMDVSMWGAPLDTCMLDIRYREKFQDAMAVVISDQERAGLDILTNGDYHLDADLAGRSWFSYPTERLAGVSEYDTETTFGWSYPVGSWLNEIVGGWKYHAVVDKVGPRVPLEFAKIWRVTQARTERPVKFGTIAADLAATVLTVKTDAYAQDKQDLMWDIATILNAELRELQAAGCRVIQIEEPAIHSSAAYGAPAEVLDFLVDLFNHTVDGLDDVELWIHTCWGNPNMQKVYSGESYENSIDIYLNRLKGDVWTIEATENDFKEIPLFKPFADNLQKKIAVGVISHRTLQGDFPETIADRIRRCLEVIPADKLVLSTDCGFGRQGFNRTVAFFKAAGIAQGRNIVLKELGLEARYVAAADPSLQPDVRPDHEPITHLPSPWIS
jgi:5-methyltetrahydropteroyltriglutamate--homocysteine methyltransferase